MAVTKTQTGFLADQYQEALRVLVNQNETAVATNVTNIAAIEQDLQSVRVQLTATQLKALAAANIQLLAAPAAGLAHVPVTVHFFMAHGGTDFIQVNGTDALALKYNGGAEITEVSSEALMTLLLEATADIGLYCNIGANFNPEVAAAIDLDNNGAAEYTAGDGTLSVELFYRTVTMAAFS